VTGNTAKHNCATCLYIFLLSQRQCQDNGTVQDLEISTCTFAAHTQDDPLQHIQNTPVTNAWYTFPVRYYAAS